MPEPQRQNGLVMGNLEINVLRTVRYADVFGQFLKSLHTMLSSGADISDALQALTKGTNNTAQPTDNRQPERQEPPQWDPQPERRDNFARFIATRDPEGLLNPLLREILETGESTGRLCDALAQINAQPLIWHKMAHGAPLDDNDVVLLLGLMLCVRPNVLDSLAALKSGLVHYGNKENAPDKRVDDLLASFKASSEVGGERKLASALREHGFFIAAAMCGARSKPNDSLGGRLITASTIRPTDFGAANQ